jgi:hypothetical protein
MHFLQADDLRPEMHGAGEIRGLDREMEKTVNGGELPNVAVPGSVTYTVLSFDVGTLTVTIDVGGGAWWTYKLAKE